MDLFLRYKFAAHNYIGKTQQQTAVHMYYNNNIKEKTYKSSRFPENIVDIFR